MTLQSALSKIVWADALYGEGKPSAPAEPFEEIDPSFEGEVPEALSGDVQELMAIDPDDPINAAFDIMFGTGDAQPQLVPPPEEENPFAANLVDGSGTIDTQASLPPRELEPQLELDSAPELELDSAPEPELESPLETPSLDRDPPSETSSPVPAPLLKALTPPPLPKPKAQVHKRPLPTLPPRGDLILGIDLGTTFSCAAIAEKGSVHVLGSRWGTPTIPSVVTFMPDGRVLVGEAALRYAATHPERTIIGWKRLLGRPFQSEIVQEVRSHFAYQVVEGERGEAAVQIDDLIIPLEDVAAAILQEIRESAALQVNGRLNRAVITCPAHFNERQREAVRRAGELAGFYVERVLGEPTSAAMHFGIGRDQKNRTVLVYDLGGGTFDVSLLRVDGDTYEVLATGGDTFLGGLDFDACIGRVLTEAFVEQEKIDPRNDPVALARLLQFAEKAKRELSQVESYQVEIDHLVVQPHAARSLSVKLEREKIEALWAPLVDHTIEIVKGVLERAKLTTKEIDEVVLVGGQSRTPLVHRQVEALFERTLKHEVNPDEAIALGASQFAESLDGDKNVVLIEALPVSIGVALPGGRMKKIIERDTRLPAERTYHLHTTRDNQERFEIILYQGDDEHVDHDDPLGIVELDHLPKGPKGSVGVLVTLRVNGECVLEVSARETKTGRTVGARLATKHTSQEIRKKLRLPPAPTTRDAHQRRATMHRPKGVWGWLTRIFGGN